MEPYENEKYRSNTYKCRYWLFIAHLNPNI